MTCTHDIMIEALNAGVVTLILALAIFTIVARELFAAAAGFIAYGLLLTLIWVQLHGVDVALIEAIGMRQPYGHGARLV